ncbi:unnamed protein product [Vitrella brassicaformis CCMP3155]|uniref:Citrate synthase n=3 Tax=Vitrella brassicaformis TaxID=1169539 RepID=A0A0G4EW69_VITBC|nr:unnamed protein product [Vitrella brassicaformis CCMP3155]|eukprot:CEM02703.1 unnamed protein product [Vitrella brassicaformis CCMP3155]
MDRLSVISGHFHAGASPAPIRETLTIVDNRTGRKYEVSVQDNTIKAVDLKQIKDSDGTILQSYDPGYTNTCACTSRISFIDGGKGILRYRGYPIEQLAERTTMEEIAFLLWYGELPSADQLDRFTKGLLSHANLHEDVKSVIRAHRHDAHPMGIFIAALANLGTLHPEGNPALAGQGIYKDVSVRNRHMLRILGGATTIGALILRHRTGGSFIPPNESLGFTGNFLYMLDAPSHPSNPFRPHPKLVRALDVLFILHAEHELNCSTSATRHLASSNVDVYTTIAGATGALYGPRHGGANEAVVRMLEKIGKVENIPSFLDRVKKREELLMGFGHRVYRSYDPRARIIRTVAEEVFEVLGREPMIEVAIELEKRALNDDYFVKRKLYPNVDFYSGLIYKAMGFPTDFFPILFTIPRIAGWLAHWNEFQDDPENRIVRPFQVYKGYDLRELPHTSKAARPKLVSDSALKTQTTSAERRGAVRS